MRRCFAFGISIPLGIALAGVMVYSTLAFRALYPNIVFFQLIPKIALAPLFIVWLGIGSSSRVTFSMFICSFPILGCHRRRTAIRRDDHAAAVPLFAHVGLASPDPGTFPTSPPYIFSGMKVAVTLAIIGIVVGEFIASQQGLGYLILFASSRQQTDLALACIAVLCVVGLVLYGCVVLCEKAVMRIYDIR